MTCVGISPKCSATFQDLHCGGTPFSSRAENLQTGPGGTAKMMIMSPRPRSLLSRGWGAFRGSGHGPIYQKKGGQERGRTALALVASRELVFQESYCSGRSRRCVLC